MGRWAAQHPYKFQQVWGQKIMTFSQSEFDVRCEWGEYGVAQLAPISDVVILVDMARGFAKDVALAATLNVSACVPVFRDGAYVP